jgi:hypothetical protein
MKIILISGKAEAGKDTTAEILKEILYPFGLESIRLAYGDYVKTTAREIWGWNGSKDEAGRALLQWWGTECVRQKEPTFWVDSVIRLVKVLPDNIDFVFIPDVRFPNEITAWQEAGFDIISVRVERPGHVSALNAEQLKHISETALDNWAFDVVLIATNREELEKEVQNKLLPILK